MKNASLGFGIGIVALALIGGWWYLSQQNTVSVQNERQPSTSETLSDDTPIQREEAPSASIGDENLVQFACDGGQTMTAVFVRDILGLTLSDGRQMELRQGISGSGIRYVNANESIEFRGKGNDAYLQEDGETTYENCTADI